MAAPSGAWVDADDTPPYALKIGDWDAVERIYNGGGKRGAHAANMRATVVLFGDIASAAG